MLIDPAILRPVLSHAFPRIVGAVSSVQSVSQIGQVVALPANYSAGDLLILLMANQGNGRTPSASGWTVDISAFGMSSTGEVNMLHKVSDGSEGASVTVALTSGTTGAFSAYAIRGWRNFISKATSLSLGPVVFVNAAAADTGEFSITSQSNVAPFLIIYFWGADVSATTTPLTPANYRDPITATIANSVQSASAWRNKFWLKEDPDPWVESGGTVTGRAVMVVVVKGT